MSIQTKILIVEHDPNDLELMQNELKKGGINYTAEIVQDGPAYELALKNFIPDIILSDYSLPSFDGLTAFKIREKMAPDTPFIFVSGTIGEENSIALINNGVTDFVLKDKLFTLNTKVNRALKEAKENQQIIETEQKLIQSESLLSRAQQLARMGSFEKYFETGKLEWSAETYRIFNCDPKTFMPASDSLLSMIHPEDRKAMENWIAASSSGINPGPLDYRLNTSDGSVKYIHGQAEIIFNEAGKAIKAIGTSQDITERKKVQQNLEKSLKEVGDYKYAIDQSSTVEIADSEGKIIFANENFCKLLKYTKEELIGQDHRIMNSGYHPKSFFTQLWNTIKSGKTFKGEIKNKAKDGSFFWVDTAIVPFLDETGKPYQYMIFREDITARKLSEETIRKSEEKYRDLIENISDLICTHDIEGRILSVNPAAEKLLGYEANTLLTMNIQEILVPAVKDQYSHYIAAIKKYGFSQGLMKIRTRTGNIRIWEYSNSLRTVGVETPIVRGLAKDVTERKQAEKALAESNQLNKQIIQSVQDGIIVYDRNLHYREWNPFMEKITGLPASQVLGKHPSELFPFLEAAGVTENIKKALAGEIVTSPDFHFTIPGSEISGWVSDTNAPLKNLKGEIIGVIGTVREITERKNAFEKIEKAENQIRNFAKHLNHVLEDERAGIAREIHDELGQQLVGIKIGLSSLKKTGNSDNNIEGKINSIMNDVDHTIQSLRKIATQLRPGILDSLGLIPSVQWLGSEFEKKTKIKCKMEVSVAEQKFEKNISTCFFRICQEALTNISKHAGASEVTIRINQIENELMLKISDNGKGIASEKLENPFSMGLLGMRERANIIGAELLITSQKDKGTTIQLKANLPPS